jgi:hypothetical protein
MERRNLVPILSNSKLSSIAGIVNPSPTPQIILALDAQRNILNESPGSHQVNPDELISSLVYCINLLCNAMNKGHLHEHRQFILSCHHTILQFSDSPILWNLSIKHCCVWLVDDHSLLSSSEQVDLFRNIINLEKWAMEIHSKGTLFRLLALIEQVAAHQVGEKSGPSFKRAYPLKSEVSTAVSLGSYSFLCSHRELRKVAVSRFFRSNNLKPQDLFITKFVHLLQMNWKNVENRYWLSCLPSILLTGFENHNPIISTTKFEEQGFLDTKRTCFEFSSSHPFFQFANDAKSQTHETVVESLCELSFLSPAVANTIWQEFLRLFWNSSQEHLRRSLCHELSCHISRHDYLNLSWPFHQCYQNIFSPTNIPSILIRTILDLSTVSLFSPEFLGAVGAGYGFWHESCEQLLKVLESKNMTRPETEHILKIVISTLSDIGDVDSIRTSFYKFCQFPSTKKIFSLEAYSNFSEEQEVTIQTIKSWASPQTSEEIDHLTAGSEPLEFGIWEERWIDCAKKLSQWNVISTYADTSQLPSLGMEAASMKCDWNFVKKIKTMPEILIQYERNNCHLKLAEAQAHIVDQKLSAAEKCYSNAVQMALIQWSMLPSIHSLNGVGDGTSAHKKMLHFFHRAVEIRDSITMMNDIGTKSSKDKSLPDFKTNLITWRDRLPNSSDNFMAWEQILQWRAQFFQTIKGMYHTITDEAQLASLHDNTWTVISLAKQARKHNLRDVNVAILSRLQSVTTMDIYDAYTKLREEVMVCFGGDAEVVAIDGSQKHLHGVNIINSTNLEYFSPQQKAELIRLKALLQLKLNLVHESKQSLSQCVQMCPNYSKSWITWGELYFNEYYKNVTAQNSNILSNIQIIEEGQCVIACILKGIESNSDEGRIQLSRILLILMSHDENTSYVLTRFLVQEAKHIPIWTWIPFLPSLFHLLRLKQREYIFEIIKGIALQYPQSVSHLIPQLGNERRSGTEFTAYLGQLRQLLKLNNETLSSDVNYFYGELENCYQPFQPCGQLLTFFENLFRDLIDDSTSDLSSTLSIEIRQNISEMLSSHQKISPNIFSKLREDFSFCSQIDSDFPLEKVRLTPSLPLYTGHY